MLNSMEYESVDAKPLVSILIPAFNAQEWIAETLRSALTQTWEQKEIIVVDDGSTDRTLSIARKFESNYLRVVTQTNQGAAAARNTAFSLSHGTYIQWLDADDLLAPDKIARQFEVLNGCATDRTLVSCAWTRFLNRPYRTNFVPNALWCDLTPTDFLLRKLGQNLFMPDSAWLVHRQLTEAAGPWDTTMYVDDDGEYFGRVLAASDGVRFVPKARIYYRISGFQSVSNVGRSEKKLQAQWRSMQLQIGYLRSLEESDRVRSACVQYLQTWISYFYPDKIDILGQFRELAKSLGGQLEEPRLPWKYEWIRTLFGWHAAQRARTFLVTLRWSAQHRLDALLFDIETRLGITTVDDPRTRVVDDTNVGPGADPVSKVPN
jgi:glycosyltransferase involved in cell wall biosynthesis